MTSVTARRAHAKILLFTFTGPKHGSRMDYDRTTGRSALLEGRPSRLEPPFGASLTHLAPSLEPTSLQASLVPPPTKDGRSLG
jgi:hypothetical protein